MQPTSPFPRLEMQVINTQWQPMKRIELACWEANGWSVVKKGPRLPLLTARATRRSGAEEGVMNADYETREVVTHSPLTGMEIVRWYLAGWDLFGLGSCPDGIRYVFRRPAEVAARKEDQHELQEETRRR